MMVFLTLYFGETVKVKGIESNSWVELSDGYKRLELGILVESIKVYEGYSEDDSPIPEDPEL